MVEQLKCNLHYTLKKAAPLKELEIKAKQSFFSDSSSHSIHKVTAYLCLSFGYLRPSARSPLPASFC